MNFFADAPVEIGNSNTKYICSSAHRGHIGHQKSIWAITLAEEVACFSKSVSEVWNYETYFWGLHIIGASPAVLGINRFREDVKIAIFVDASRNLIYHGYPADYRRKIKDRPHVNILKKWRDQGLIQKHMMNKIMTGKQCSL